MDQNLKGALLPKITAIELKSIGKTLDASMQSISTPQNSQKQSITPKFTISEDNYSNNSYENVYPCYDSCRCVRRGRWAGCWIKVADFFRLLPLVLMTTKASQWCTGSDALPLACKPYVRKQFTWR